VEHVGPGVTRFAKGDRVFARVDKHIMGAFAEYAVVHADHAVLMPASLDFPSAAGVPLAALTALQALRDELHLSPGQRIFIPGGAGGVGTFAIQIAKHLGPDSAVVSLPRVGGGPHHRYAWREAANMTRRGKLRSITFSRIRSTSTRSPKFCTGSARAT
jgi:NADPH:quinone reductase-like Zn-dependent oxidoreductase